MAKHLDINGELVDFAEVRAKAAALRHQREAGGKEIDFEQRVALQEEALELVVDRALLAQEAERLGLTPGESELTMLLDDIAGRFDGVAGCRAGADTPESREDLRRHVLVDRLVERWCSTIPAPRAEEVRSHYRKNKEQFRRPELIHASHFVRACETEEAAGVTRAEVERARDRVLAGEDFEMVAAHHSDCPEKGGDLGWFGRGVMVDEFDDGVFASPIKQLTPVFRTVFGFHFAVVHNRRPEGIRPFDEVRDEVTRSLWLVNQDREVGRQLAELRARAVVKVVR